MGVVQHHDGVSGTEKQEVAFDYAQRLSFGINVAQVCEQKSILRDSIILYKYSNNTLYNNVYVCLDLGYHQ
jgi:hypothetical protein